MVKYHVNIMDRCLVCKILLTSETQSASFIVECGCPPSSHSCVRKFIENVNPLLCSDCIALVSEYRSTLIDDNRNNTPSDDERILQDLYNAIIHNLGFDWTYVSIFMIFIVLLCLIVYIIIG